MIIKYEDIDARTRLYFVFLSYFWLDKNFQGLAAASFDILSLCPHFFGTTRTFSTASLL